MNGFSASLIHAQDMGYLCWNNLHPSTRPGYRKTLNREEEPVLGLVTSTKCRPSPSHNPRVIKGLRSFPHRIGPQILVRSQNPRNAPKPYSDQFIQVDVVEVR